MAAKGEVLQVYRPVIVLTRESNGALKHEVHPQADIFAIGTRSDTGVSGKSLLVRIGATPESIRFILNPAPPDTCFSAADTTMPPTGTRYLYRHETKDDGTGVTLLPVAQNIVDVLGVVWQAER